MQNLLKILLVLELLRRNMFESFKNALFGILGNFMILSRPFGWDHYFRCLSGNKAIREGSTIGLIHFCTRKIWTQGKRLFDIHFPTWGQGISNKIHPWVHTCAHGNLNKILLQVSSLAGLRCIHLIVLNYPCGERIEKANENASEQLHKRFNRRTVKKRSAASGPLDFF